MTEEQFKNVKCGDILNYTLYSGQVVRVKVRGTYRFAGSGRIAGDIIDSCEYLDCDAPISCFELEPKEIKED